VPDSDAGVPVLVLNSGSSSIKFGLYRAGPARTEMLLAGVAESIGDKAGTLHAENAAGMTLCSEATPNLHQGQIITRIKALIAESHLPAPAAIGHRIVHGGPRLRQHCLIDATVLRQLEAAAPFAPLHTAPALSLIDFAQAHFPGLPQAACFDTCFHAALPDVARILPVPRAMQLDGIQRYGFHGLSCESILHQLSQEPVPVQAGRLVIAHLGNGASVTAVKCGKSIDTSMGLTPSGGVMMGTRSGDLDPGLLAYLMRERKFDAAMVEALVDHQSGLLGVSGLFSDMRSLRGVAPSNPDARLAVDMFCYCVRKQVAAMIAALDGADLLVFTGGIGENDAESRTAISSGLSWIGIGLDQARNRARRNPISDASSRCPVLVLTSEENEQIARHTRDLCSERLC
jgi:acetate kinase